MARDMTEEQAAVLKTIWKIPFAADEANDAGRNHLPDAVLYDLALGELPAEEQRAARQHLADCDVCINTLVELQTAIATDSAVQAVWSPEVLHASGESQSPAVIEDQTQDGKYVITLQPTRDGRKDQLTLAVSSSFQDRLEGQKVIIFSGKGTRILEGTISGGNITRFIALHLRDEWPFHIHAG